MDWKTFGGNINEFKPGEDIGLEMHLMLINLTY